MIAFPLVSLGKAAAEGCPADVESLGRGTWGLLHTMAANYPLKPSNESQTDMKNFIGLFSKLYPQCVDAMGE